MKVQWGIVPAALAMTLAAGEALVPARAGDWLGEGKIVFADGVFRTGRNTILSRGFLAVDPARRYRVSGEFRISGDDGKTSVNFGVAPLDAMRRLIRPVNTIVSFRSDNELVAPCARGDTQLKVKANRDWVVDKYRHVAFGTDKTGGLADLPNYRVSCGAPVKIENSADGTMTVTLSRPLEWSFPAGTGVRLHCDGGAFLCAAGENLKVPDKWTAFSGELTGVSHGHTRKNFRTGTKYAKILIVVNAPHGSGAVAEFRNVRLEELKFKSLFNGDFRYGLNDWNVPTKSSSGGAGVVPDSDKKGFHAEVFSPDPSRQVYQSRNLPVREIRGKTVLQCYRFKVSNVVKGEKDTITVSSDVLSGGLSGRPCGTVMFTAGLVPTLQLFGTCDEIIDWRYVGTLEKFFPQCLRRRAGLRLKNVSARF